MAVDTGFPLQDARDDFLRARRQAALSAIRRRCTVGADRDLRLEDLPVKERPRGTLERTEQERTPLRERPG